MGMTIDEHIATLKEHLNILNVDKGVEFYKEIEAIQSAIETMHKYQQIEKIIEVWHQDIYAKDFESIAEVAEVVEDGSN